MLQAVECLWNVILQAVECLWNVASIRVLMECCKQKSAYGM